MTMVRQCNSSLIVQKCVLLITVVVIHGTGGEICDKRKCRGPLRVYESLGCTPVYAKPNDCCAESYDCSHLDNLPQDKCYANGHEYRIGEMLRSEDSNPCDIGCVCDITVDGLAAFVCKPVYCEHLLAEGNYYFRYTHDSCCRNATQICLKDGEERPTCEVDDNIYYDGDLFETKCNRDLRCICMPGYIGENVEPFCRKRNRRGCSILFGSPFLVRRKCAPMFVDGQNPYKDCSNFFRCPSRKDIVIRNYSNIEFAKVAKEEGKVCRFGNMTMRINDELSRRTIHARDCMQCVCEVPPFLTCQRLRDEERCQIQYQDVVISADLSCQNTKQSVGAIYTRTNFVTLKYVTDSWGTISNGFRLVITAVKDPKHTCKDFRCTQNEFCIETDLLCDGVNHCGDGSDEVSSTLCANSEVSTILGMQTIWFAVALIFLILSVAGLVTAAVFCFCRQRAATPRHPHNAHNAQTHPPVSFPLQQMYGSNGASAGLPVGMTTLKSTTGTLGALGTYGSALGSGVTGATTLPRPGNWLRPAGLRHGHSAARVRLYCQAK